MKNMNIYTKVSLNIIVVFFIAMLGTFIPESFPQFFGDWICQGQWREVVGNIDYPIRRGCNYAGWETHNPTTHWGARHWIWMFMSWSLFIAQVVRIVSIINKQNP